MVDCTVPKYPLLETVKKDKVLVKKEFKEYDETGDVAQFFEFALDTTIDALQIQVRVDTAGATPGVVDSIRYNLGYRQ